MRRRSVLPSLVLATALLLAACSSSPDDAASPSGSLGSSPEASSEASGDSAEPSPDSTAPIEVLPEVNFTASGVWGEKPTLEFGSETAPEGLRVDVLSEGDGAVVAAGDFVVAHYLGQVWGTDNVFDNSFDRGAPSGFPLGGVVQGWQLGLAGQHVGSRVLLSIPSELGYPTGNTGAGIAAGDTIVFVVDLVDAFNGDSSGQADAVPTDAVVPVTVTGDLGAPVTGIEVAADAVAVTEPRATVLATGSGNPIPATGEIVVQYAYQTWDNTEFYATWSPDGVGPEAMAPIGSGSAFDAIVGVPVGSRVLIEVPADTETGAPPLAVVVDVLGAY